MKKEVILAITIGFGLGLIITYGVWLANKSLKSLPQTSTETQAPTSAPISEAPTTPTSSPKTTAAPAGQLSITISSPIDEFLSDKDTTKVEGTTIANSVVVLTYEGSEQIVTSDEAGKFSADISLDGGYNLVTATVYDKSGNTATTMITATFTTSKI